MSGCFFLKHGVHIKGSNCDTLQPEGPLPRRATAVPIFLKGEYTKLHHIWVVHRSITDTHRHHHHHHHHHQTKYLEWPK